MGGKKSWVVTEIMRRKRLALLAIVFTVLLLFCLVRFDFSKTKALTPREPRLSCCKQLPSGKRLAELCALARDSPSECSCEDFMYCRMVVVTAVSSNHFQECQSFIGSVQTYLPTVKILIYDLGLSDSDRALASSYCNVEIRPLKYDKFPAHVRDLYTYAWKPVLLDEVTREYEIILYGDASARIVGPYIYDALRLLRHFPFIAGRRHKLPFMSFVHEDMLQYMKYPMSRKMLYNVGGVEANLFMFWANNTTKSHIVDPLLDCALHKECIAPEGAVLHGCAWYYPFIHSHWFRDGSYVGSHRYDQSALNLILVREFGFGRVKDYLNQTLNDALWHVDRTEKKFNHHIYFDARSC